VVFEVKLIVKADGTAKKKLTRPVDENVKSPVISFTGDNPHIYTSYWTTGREKGLGVPWLPINIRTRYQAA
jgi:hypothetical protein